MARKPNYSMERRQREKARQDKAQERQKLRQEQAAQRKAPREDGSPDVPGSDEPTQG